MSTIPPITAQDVRNLVGEGRFQRGQKYFQDDRIFDTRGACMILKAKCAGNPYPHTDARSRQKLGKHDFWTRYMKRLRERHQNLKAFQNVLSASGP